MATYYDNDKTRMEAPVYHEHARVHHEHMSAATYAATRISTLKPPMANAPNPFTLIRMLNVQQWMFFLVAFFAWSWDAFDFFTVSLTVSQLAKQFDKSASQITWGITLVLMFRSVGSTLFGKPKVSLPVEYVLLILGFRYRRRSIWTEMALRCEQYPVHRSRVRDWFLSKLQAVLGLQSTLWSCHGRIVRQRCSNCVRGLPFCGPRTYFGNVTTRIRVWISTSDGLRPSPG